MTEEIVSLSDVPRRGRQMKNVWTELVERVSKLKMGQSILWCTFQSGIGTSWAPGRQLNARRYCQCAGLPCGTQRRRLLPISGSSVVRGEPSDEIPTGRDAVDGARRFNRLVL